MADDRQHPKVGQVAADVEKDYDAMAEGRKGGFFGRFSSRLNEALQEGRGPERGRDESGESAALPSPASPAASPQATADDLAMRRAKNVNPARMIVPEGVVIEGSLMGGTDTEIHGKITGDISIDGRLYLGQSALVSGNVKATSCRVDGLVEGKVECSDEVELGQSGRLNADLLAGRRINLGGQVYGNVATPGAVRMASTCRVVGDVRARQLAMEEGASLNGKCAIRPQQQQAPQAQGAGKR